MSCAPDKELCFVLFEHFRIYVTLADGFNSHTIEYYVETKDGEDKQRIAQAQLSIDGMIDGKVNISSTDESSYFTRTDDTLTLNVVNKKPTYPSTGGAGTFIGFALLGTAVMLAAIAYYGIYANNKNSRRS